jgi:class 3 adenylate cyclase
MNTGGRVRAERRLAATVAADMVGYSRLIGTDEEGTLEALRSIRVEAIDPKIVQAALAESSKAKPNLDPSARLRTVGAWYSPQYVPILEKNVGLRRSGFPDE